MNNRLRIDLAYDGARFSGWARQPNRTTVQGEVEGALSQVCRTDPGQLTTVVAGRTDAGVHATGQVCHVEIPPGVEVGDPERLCHRLRRFLGSQSGIWIIHVGWAPEGFDARFSPLSRRYEYRIADDHSTKDPRRVGHTLWLNEALDVGGMNSLGQALLGLHDWASFCRARTGATTIRHLQRFDWARDDEGVVVATVQADAFCHSMVRSLVGAAVEVGRGRANIDQIVALRDTRARTSTWKTLPGLALTLCEVTYPDDGALADRAEQTRARRDGEPN